MENWYLLRSRPKQEKRAEIHVNYQGYQSYCPIVSVNKSRSPIPRLVTEPLFPGYLFVRLNPQKHSFNAVRSTRGIQDFVRFGDLPAKVPDHLIDELKVNVPEIEIGLSHSIEFEEGDKVRVAAGCFRGYEAIYRCEKGRDRVLVLINLVGKSAELQLEKSMLEKC